MWSIHAPLGYEPERAARQHIRRRIAEEQAALVRAEAMHLNRSDLGPPPPTLAGEPLNRAVLPVRDLRCALRQAPEAFSIAQCKDCLEAVASSLSVPIWQSH